MEQKKFMNFCLTCNRHFWGDSNTTKCEECKSRVTKPPSAPEVEEADRVWEDIERKLFDIWMEQGLANAASKAHSTVWLWKQRMAASTSQTEDELRSLRQWKESAMSLFRQIDEYADKHPDIKLGKSKVEFVIDRARKYDQAASADPFSDVGKSYIAGYNAGKAAGTGAVWVKSSERLPEKDGYYCFKANGGYMSAYLRTGSNGNRWWCDSAGGTIRNWKNCEWLDESTPSKESDAVTFARFIIEERWEPGAIDKWLGHENGKEIILTTEQLYQLFKQRTIQGT